jgi:hypothetical protein
MEWWRSPRTPLSKQKGPTNRTPKPENKTVEWRRTGQKESFAGSYQLKKPIQGLCSKDQEVVSKAFAKTHLRFSWWRTLATDGRFPHTLPGIRSSGPEKPPSSTGGGSRRSSCNLSCFQVLVAVGFAQPNRHTNRFIIAIYTNERPRFRTLATPLHCWHQRCFSFLGALPEGWNLAPFGSRIDS